MAVEYCPSSSSPSTSPENPGSRNMSPRISFSHDLCKYDVVPVEAHAPLSPSSLSASASFNFDFDSSTSRGSVPADELFSNGFLLPSSYSFKTEPPAPPAPPVNAAPQPQSKPRKPPPHTSSFWKFRRSRSCNCGSMYSGSLCPILLLPRSKSTGSTSSSSKKSLISNAAKQRALNPAYQKPPLNKTNGFRVAPVLNVSSGNLFGLASLFTSKLNKKK